MTVTTAILLVSDVERTSPDLSGPVQGTSRVVVSTAMVPKPQDIKETSFRIPGINVGIAAAYGTSSHSCGATK